MLVTMASTPYPLPRETRQSSILTGNGTTGPYGPTLFKVWDTADVVVEAKGPQDETWFKVPNMTVTKTAGLPFDTVSVVFPQLVPETFQFQIRSSRTHERSVAAAAAGSLSSAQLEKELSKQGSVLQELRRDEDRALHVEPGANPIRVVGGAEGRMPKFNADGHLVPGPSAGDVEAVLAASTAFHFASVAVATAAAIPLALSFVAVAGRYSAGDGGEAIYRRVEAAPSHAGKFQSLDGAWWELAPLRATPQMFGAKTDGATDALAALTALSASPFRSQHFPDGAYKLSANWQPTLGNVTHSAGGNVTFTGAGRPDFSSLIPYQGGPIWAQQLNRKLYDSAWSGYGNIFHTADYISTTIASAGLGGGNVVARYAGAEASGANSSAWATNFVAYANHATGTAIASEINFGALVNGGSAYGIVLASAGNYAAKAALQIQANNVASRAEKGLLFHNRSYGIALDALIGLDGDTTSSL